MSRTSRCDLPELAKHTWAAWLKVSGTWTKSSCGSSSMESFGFPTSVASKSAKRVARATCLYSSLAGVPKTLMVAREYPLHYIVQGQDRVIGTLRVEATLAGVYRRLANTASTILVTQAATIFLVSLFILYFFHHLVTRHLSAIAADVGSHRINDAATGATAAAASAAATRTNCSGSSQPSTHCLTTCTPSTAMLQNAKQGSDAWSTPTSSGSSSGISKDGFSKPMTHFCTCSGTDATTSPRAVFDGQI